jgi:thymidine phosphorylase
VVQLGGGRLRKGDVVDHGVGLEIVAPVGCMVSEGDPLVHVRAPSEDVALGALPLLDGAWRIGPRPVELQPHLRYRIDRGGIRLAGM